MMPLYESKMIHQYDTRWATYTEEGGTRLLTDEEKARRTDPMPRYWVHEDDVARAWGDRVPTGPYFAWRGIARTTDARTAIGTVMPRDLPGGGNFDMVLDLERGYVALFAALFTSFAFDYTARQKLSNMHLQFSVVKQLPLPSPASCADPGFVAERSFASWFGLQAELLGGWVANPNRRLQIRCELDAAAFHLYGVSRSDAEYVMETFSIVKRKDVNEFGTYRTKELIMAAYEAMAEAKVSGIPYKAPWEDA